MTGNTLNLAARAKESALTGFTLNNAIHEAIGAASVCWGEGGVFDEGAAMGVAKELQEGVAEFVRVAINQQSLDARADTADWELVKLIFQAPAIGWEAA